MKYIFALLLLIPLNLWAGWNAEIALGIDGESWKIERTKIEENKELSLEMGNHVLKLTIKKSQEPKTFDILYTIHELKKKKLVLVNTGEDTIDEKQVSKEIYAKGQPGQPHSIITLKLKPL